MTTQYATTNKRSLLRDDRGLSTVEYVILLVLIAAGSVGLWLTLGKKIYSQVNDANGELDNNLGLDKVQSGDDH